MQKLSIIIPVYNVESYISKCLDTIVNQIYNNLEIIIINDGSSDNSLEIINEFARKDSRIKVFSQKNKGVSAARNLGLENTTGELIGFVDPDDWIDTKMYKILIDLMNEHQADVSSCHLRGCFSRDYVESASENNKIEVFNHIETLEKFLSQAYSFNGLNAVVVNRVYRRDIFNDLRFNEDLIKGEDTEIIHKIFFKSQKLVFIDERLYFYFRRNDGLTHSEISTENRVKVDVNILNLFENKINTTRGNIIYNTVYLNSINDLLSYNIELYFNYSTVNEKKLMKKHFYNNYSKFFRTVVKKFTISRNLRFILFLISPKLYKAILLSSNA